MTIVFNSTLQTFMNLSSTVCIPRGYDKVYPQLSVEGEGFVPNHYYNLMGCFADAEDAFEYFKQLAQIIMNRPYNPLFANAVLLSTLQNVLGLTFITESLTQTELQNILYAKLLANVNNGTIQSTIEVFKYLVQAESIFRIRLGVGTTDVSYTAIGYDNPLSQSEIASFWYSAHTGGIFIELRTAPLDYFAFFEDPNGLGFSSTEESGQVVQAIPPYFGFFEDPDATGFGILADPLSGGNFPSLVTPTEGGGSWATIITNPPGVS